MEKLNNSTLATLKASDKLTLDAACKQILKDPLLLAVIFKEVIPEYKDVSEYDIATKYIEGPPKEGIPVSKNLTNKVLTGSAEEDVSINEGIVKYDVLVEAKAPITITKKKYSKEKETKNILINLRVDLEAQNKYNVPYPITKRAAYYCARLLSSQFGGMAESADYANLYKVYSIWICFDVPEYLSNTISRFKAIKEDLLGSVDIPERDYNLMESVIIRLGRQEKNSESRMIKTLQAIFGEYTEADKDNRLKELGFQGTTLAKEVKRMYSFSDMYEDRGLKKGMQKGIEKERSETIKKLSDKGFSVKEIAKMLDINETEIRSYLSEKSKLVDA